MKANHNQSTDKRTKPHLLWLLSLAILLLVVWQIPLVDLAHRQAGTRAFLQVAVQTDPLSANYWWPVFVNTDETLESVVWHLRQANSTLDVDRILGVVMLAKNDPIAAQQWLLRRLQTAPHDVIALLFLGDTYLRLGDVHAAIEQWEEIGAQVPLMRLARDSIEREAQDDALKALGAVMRLNTTDLESRRLAAKILIKQGNTECALALAQEIITIAPQRAEGYMLGGLALFDAGQHERAIPFLEQTLRRSSAVPSWMWVRLGQSYAALGQWPEAIEAYEQAINEDPARSSWVYVHMGEAKCQLKRPEDARFYYEQAVALGNQSNQVRQVIEYLTRHGDCPEDKE